MIEELSERDVGGAVSMDRVEQKEDQSPKFVWNWDSFITCFIWSLDGDQGRFYVWEDFSFNLDVQFLQNNCQLQNF